MGKKSEFELLADHKDKQITKVSFRNGNVGIFWNIISEDFDGEKHVNKGYINNHEPSHEEFDAEVDKLIGWVKGYFIPSASKTVEEKWEKNLFITEIGFNHNSKGITATVSASYCGDDKQHGELKVPATPLYHKEIEGHANGAMITFGEEYTKALEDVIKEAKMYLSGKRGAMQTTLEEQEA